LSGESWSMYIRKQEKEKKQNSNEPIADSNFSLFFCLLLLVLIFCLVQFDCR
jgi:hypothetical protein